MEVYSETGNLACILWTRVSLLGLYFSENINIWLLIFSIYNIPITSLTMPFYTYEWTALTTLALIVNQLICWICNSDRWDINFKRVVKKLYIILDVLYYV